MFTPRRPVRSFQDLEVYQKLLAVSVAVGKRVIPADAGIHNIDSGFRRNDMVNLALDLPLKIATAHSLRFADHAKALATLEEAMLGCNLLIVYLEQYRDIDNCSTSAGDSSQKGGGNEAGSGIELSFFEEQIKTLLTVRFKIMHLQASWKKFGKEKDA